jgi:hypothetical protein
VKAIKAREVVMKRSARLSFLLLLLISLTGSAAAHVSLDYPVGGETFFVGETVTIQWHILVPHDQEDWDLYFSSNGGQSWDVLVSNLPVEQLSYLWTVPDVITEQGRVRVIQDNTGTDYSDSSGNFTIQEGSTGVDGQGDQTLTLALHAAHPNPFSDTTSISFTLPVAGTADLAIYARSGQRVRRLLSAQRPAGEHSIQWDGRDETGDQVPTGAYVCRLAVGSFTEAREIVLLR